MIGGFGGYGVSVAPPSVDPPLYGPPEVVVDSDVMEVCAEIENINVFVELVGGVFGGVFESGIFDFEVFDTDRQAGVLTVQVDTTEIGGVAVSVVETEGRIIVG